MEYLDSPYSESEFTSDKYKKNFSFLATLEKEMLEHDVFDDSYGSFEDLSKHNEIMQALSALN